MKILIFDLWPKVLSINLMQDFPNPDISKNKSCFLYFTLPSSKKKKKKVDLIFLLISGLAHPSKFQDITTIEILVKFFQVGLLMLRIVEIVFKINFKELRYEVDFMHMDMHP